MNVLNTDMVTRDEKVAYIADLFIDKFAERIVPITSLEGALFGHNTPVGDSKLIVLEGAVQAANELWLGERGQAKRLANQAIDQALRLIRSDLSTDDIGLRHVIEKALPLIYG